MKLEIEKYNFLEKGGRINLSNRFLEAFQPEIFKQRGFPTFVENEKEIYRFFDSMNDGRLRLYYESHRMAPTEDEFEKIQSLSAEICSLSQNQYGRAVVVKAPLLSDSCVMRQIHALSDTANNAPTIFEIGGVLAH